MKNNLTSHKFNISRNEKEIQFKTKGVIFWLTGLSGSGKSTIANEFEKIAFSKQRQTKILDGDDIRTGLCQDLDFSQSDRKENLRRIGEVAKLFAQNGCITLCCFISPLEEHRQMLSKIIGNDFKLIYINTSLEICEKRDPKGLYEKARAGQIKNFTGIDSSYEEPKNADLVLNSETDSVKMSANKLYEYYLKEIYKL